MNDPWTWATEWAMTVEVGSGLGRGGYGVGGNWDNSNRVTMKYFLKMGEERNGNISTHPTGLICMGVLY